MSLALLTPWQQLLWLVCAFILIIPILAAGVTTVIRGYFNAKENHIGKIARAIGNTLSKASDETLKTLKEELKKAKEKIVNDEKKT